MNTNKISTGSVNRKLLAALAVLAVAFVVLAAVPAVATDSDAESTTTDTPAFIAAYLISDDDEAADAYNLLRNLSGSTAIEGKEAPNLYVAYSSTQVVSTLYVSYTYTLASGAQKTETQSWGQGTTGGFFSVFTDDKKVGFTSALTQDIDTIKELKVGIAYNTAPSDANGYTSVTLKEGNIYVYQPVTITNSETVPAGVTLNLSPSDNKTTSAYIETGTRGLTLESGAKLVMPGHGNTKVTLTASSESTFIANKNSDGKIDVTVTKGDVSISDSGSDYLVGNSINSLTIAKGVTVSGTVGVSNDNIHIAASGVQAGDTPIVITKSTQSGDKAAAIITGSVAAGTITVEPFTNNTNAKMKVVAKDLSLSSTAKIVVDRGGNIVTVGAGVSNNSGITMANGAQLILDADQNQPVVFTARANSTTITSDGTSGYKLGLTSGSLELTSGQYTVASTDSMTSSSGTTFTVASGAALIVDNSSVSSGSNLLAASGRISVNGTLALTKLPTSTTSNGTTTYTADGISFANADNAVLGKAVQAYAIAVYGTHENITGISTDKFGYAGEQIDVTITHTAAYVAKQVGYKTYTGDTAPSSDYAFDANAEKVSVDAKNTTEVWKFTMPASNVSVNASAVGAYTATFVLIDENKDIVGQVVSDPYADKTVTIPTINVKGYMAAGYYTDSGLVKEIATTGNTTPYTTSDGKLYLTTAGSVIVYVKALTLSDITYVQADGGRISGASEAYTGATVIVSANADSGYQVKKVSAVDASGATVSIPYDKDGKVYKFVMPASEVTVSVTYERVYSLDVAEYDSSVTPSGKIAITAIGGKALESNISNNSNPIAEAYTAGTRITFTVTGITPVTPAWGISKYVFTASDKSTVTVDVAASYDSEKSTYTASFAMPDQDVTLSVEYQNVYKLTVKSDGNGTITAKTSEGTISTSTAAEAFDNHVAAKNSVQITVSAADGYAFKSLTVADKPVDVEGVTYTFEMPSGDTEVSVVFGPAQTLVDVTYSGYGYATYDKENNSAAPGGSINFTITPTNGYSVDKVTITQRAANVTSGNYSAAGSDVVTYTSSGNVYTLTFADSITAATNYIVDVTFKEYVPVTVTVDQRSVEYITLYSDADMTKVIELDNNNQAVREKGTTIYVDVKDRNGYDVAQAMGSYISGTGTSATTKYVTMTAVPNTNASYFTIDQSTTVKADYTAHQSVLTIDSDIENGSVKVYDGDTEIENNGKVSFDHVLTIVPAADRYYGVDTVTVNGKEISLVNDAYSYTVGLDNIAVSATFGLLYDIEKDVENGTINVADSSVADKTVTFTVTPAGGYALVAGSVKVVADGATEALELTEADGTYSFTMPSSAVTISADFQRTATGAARAVYVSLIYDSDNNNAPSVLLTGIGGYVPAGTVTVTVWYLAADGQMASAPVTIDVQEDTTVTYQTIPVSSGSSVVSATTFGAAATYSSDDGSLSARTTGFQGFVATIVASTTTQE